MKKINVLHICQAPIGGTVEYLKLLIGNLDKSKFENSVVCPSVGNLSSEMEKLNIRVKHLEMLREISPKTDLKHSMQLRKLIKEINPDVIYLHSSKAGVLGRIACIGLGKKIVYNPHGWAFTMNGSSKKKKFYALIEKGLMPFTNKVINISKSEELEALKYGFSSKKMITINNGTDVEKYSKYSDKMDYLDKFVVGFVGRLSEQKNPLFMVEIAKELKKEIDDFLFLVVGDGDLKEEFENKISAEGLKDNFKLLGWQSEVGEHIKNFDAAIMISSWEGFGLVVTEYMSAKKPVVAVRVGGVADIIENGYNGVLLEDYSAVDFAKSILRLKDAIEYKDVIVENAYKTVEEKFNIKRVVSEHEELFEGLVN